jgi:hypothetical protein
MCDAVRFLPLAVAVALSPIAPAQDRGPTAHAPPAFELTPFIGYRTGGDLEMIASGEDVDLRDSRTFAIALNLRIDQGSQYELWKPYIVGTLGATRFHADAAEASDDTRFSISLGGGLRVPFSERFSLRLEARGYVTFVDSDSALFCKTGSFGAVCELRASGSTFIQYEVLGGLAFAF